MIFSYFYSCILINRGILGLQGPERTKTTVSRYRTSGLFVFTDMRLRSPWPLCKEGNMEKETAFVRLGMHLKTPLYQRPSV